MSNPTGLGAIEEARTRALEGIRSDEIRSLVEPLFHRFDHDDAQRVIAATNKLPGTPHYSKEKGATGVAVNMASLLHHFSPLAARGYFVCEYPLWGGRGVDARFPERQFDLGFVMPAGRSTNRNVTFNIETKNYERVDSSTLSRFDRQMLYDAKRLNPSGDRQPIVPVWTFMQGLTADARRHFEARNFRVVDFTQPQLVEEMRRAFVIPQSMRVPGRAAATAGSRGRGQHR